MPTCFLSPSCDSPKTASANCPGELLSMHCCLAVLAQCLCRPRRPVILYQRFFCCTTALPLCCTCCRQVVFQPQPEAQAEAQVVDQVPAQARNWCAMFPKNILVTCGRSTEAVIPILPMSLFLSFADNFNCFELLEISVLES